MAPCNHFHDTELLMLHTAGYQIWNQTKSFSAMELYDKGNYYLY